MALTLAQAAAAFRRYGDEIPKTILGRLDKLAITAQRLSVTQFMQGLGSGKSARPPNPPPGPLGIRTGTLRRAVQRIKASADGSGGWTTGIYVDLNAAPYGAIQEFGGRTKPHVILPVKGKALAWPGIGPSLPGKGPKGGGMFIFSKRVNHPGSAIPARPYMRPALEIAASQHIAEIPNDLRALEDRILGRNA